MAIIKYITNAGGINANLAPDAFRRWANHYYACKQQFKSPHTFSPVPYFLLCRAIELGIKAKHLKHMTQEEVKRKFMHDLIKAYNALNTKELILSVDEVKLLKKANGIYSRKGFEYFNPEDALTAFKRYPDLKELDKVAKKLVR
jgi:hypothetical protein